MCGCCIITAADHFDYDLDRRGQRFWIGESAAWMTLWVDVLELCTSSATIMTGELERDWGESQILTNNRFVHWMMDHLPCCAELLLSFLFFFSFYPDHVREKESPFTYTGGKTYKSLNPYTTAPPHIQLKSLLKNVSPAARNLCGNVTQCLSWLHCHWISRIECIYSSA